MKGFIIAELNDKEIREHGTISRYNVYTEDEWDMRPNCYPEWECDNIQECEENINSK